MLVFLKQHRLTCITTNKPPCWKAWEPSLQLRFFRCPCMSLRLSLVPRATRFLVTWSVNEVGYILSRVALGTKVFAQLVCALGAHYERPSPPSWKFCIHNALQSKCSFAHRLLNSPVTEKKRKKKKKKRGGEKGKYLPANSTILQNASWYFTVRFIWKSTLVNICKIYFDLFKTCFTFFSLHSLPRFLFLLSSQLFETFSKNSRGDACYVLSIKLETSKSRAPKHQ